MSAGNNTVSTDKPTGPTSNTISSIISSISSVHSTSSAPVTTSAPPSSTAPESPSVFVTTQLSTVSGHAPSTVIDVATSTSLFPSSTEAAASSSSSSSPGYANGGSGGTGSSAQVGKIVPAVVVPVAVVALLVAGAIWFFRKRRLNKENEVRRKEAEEYGFNPNTDMAVGGDARGMVTDDNVAAMSEADGTGYRGWGTTTSARKASTTLGSASVGAAAIGLARSDSGENGAYRGGQHSPNGANGGASYSDHNSGDPLVNGGNGSRPISRDFEGVAALGTAPAAGSRTNTGVHRGPSNASSAYSAGQRSDTSGEGVTGYGSPTWATEYVGENGNYGGQDGAPVIRDVSARRNTRIEQPSVMPQQARGGISQNF